MTQSPEMPERIWVRFDRRGGIVADAEPSLEPTPCVKEAFTEYRRADLPTTAADCLRNEKVQRMQTENERLRLLLARNLVMEFGSAEEGADELGGIGAAIAMVEDYHAALEQEAGRE